MSGDRTGYLHAGAACTKRIAADHSDIGRYMGVLMTIKDWLREIVQKQQSLSGSGKGNGQKGLGDVRPGECQKGLGDVRIGECQKGLGDVRPGECQKGLGDVRVGECQKGLGDVRPEECQEGSENVLAEDRNLCCGARVVIRKGAGRSLKAGGAWIYDNEIDHVDGRAVDGAIVEVADFDGYMLGFGCINPHSKIRIRMLSRYEKEGITPAFIRRRVRDAWEYRKAVMGEDVSCCRVIFGEADFLPGITVDKFSDVLVIESLSLGTDRLKEMILLYLVEILEEDGIAIRGIYERSDAKVRELEGMERVKGFIGPEFDTMVPITENGIRYMVDVKDGQKTGFFLDQKYNRRAVGNLVRNLAAGSGVGSRLNQNRNMTAGSGGCSERGQNRNLAVGSGVGSMPDSDSKLSQNLHDEGKAAGDPKSAQSGKNGNDREISVLDCFTHTGSFGLNAAMAGASYVLSVDASVSAIDMAKQNAQRNGLDQVIEYRVADVFELLPELEEERKFDVVILDPPAFTKSRQATKNAVKGYREINLRGMKLVKDGGYLATCSCSHFMEEDLLKKTLREAAKGARKRLRQVEFRTQAPDHPILWGDNESYYLKFLIFQVMEEK